MQKRALLIVGLIAAGVAVLVGQAPATNAKDIQLVGDRFKPLKWDEMTPEQKTMMEHLASGPRRGAGGPSMSCCAVQRWETSCKRLELQMRFKSSLPPKLNEMAIIITARHWTAQYEWNAHRTAAAQAGLNEAIIQSIAAGKRPASMNADETVIYNFATELLNTKQVSDPVFKAVKDKFGERGTVDLISVMGYYQLVSMLLNVDRYPLPAGAKPELQPLK